MSAIDDLKTAVAANATPEEKERAYGEVMGMATLRQRMVEHGCKKAAICNMDHTWGHVPNPAGKSINRLCTTCYRHWVGRYGDVKEYSRAEWDAHIAKSFSAGEE